MTTSQAQNNLRVVLTGLRRILHPPENKKTPILHSNRHEVWFESQMHVCLDVAEFQELLAQCESHLHQDRATCAACQARLAQAVEIYRGEFLQGFHLDGCPAFEEWLLIQRENWHLQMSQILTELSNFYEDSGDYAQAETYVRRQLQLDPLQEISQRQLMHLLAYQGQRLSALSQYEQCQQVLQNELGVEPEADTVWLYQQIKANQLQPPQALDTAPAATIASPKHTLPEMLTPFIGRETELAQLAERLAESPYRLLTLIGPGGIGKTRLAIQTARQNSHHFKDGVYFVSLAELVSPSEIPTAILSSLKIPLSGGPESPQAHLLAYLKPRQLLLVIDNLEHLMAGVDMLTEILAHAPNVVMLVTSREELPLQAADLFVLVGLDSPKTIHDTQVQQYAALRLFADRAKRVNKNFKLTEAVLPAVLEICHLLEGLPLGIELAAAVVRDYSCAEIAAEIAHDLEILSTSVRDFPPRQRSIQAVFDYSWNLLSETEQATLAQLAVFRGGFDMPSARQVTGASRLLISQLRYKSLILSRGSGRFALHFLIRQLALKKAGYAGPEQVIP